MDLMPIGGRHHEGDNQKGIPKKVQNSNRQDEARRNQNEKNAKAKPQRRQGNRGTR
jgi:hypothetical protein